MSCTPRICVLCCKSSFDSRCPDSTTLPTSTAPSWIQAPGSSRMTPELPPLPVLSEDVWSQHSPRVVGFLSFPGSPVQSLLLSRIWILSSHPHNQRNPAPCSSLPSHMPTAPVRGICLLSPGLGCPSPRAHSPRRPVLTGLVTLHSAAPSTPVPAYSTLLLLLYSSTFFCMAWIVAPQKCPPRAYGCDLIWKRAFVDIIKGLEMRASWLGRALSPLASVTEEKGM